MHGMIVSVILRSYFEPIPLPILPYISYFISFTCTPLYFLFHFCSSGNCWLQAGRERQSAFCLMQKFVDLQSLGSKMQIISAFSVDHIKGFIFIEADKQCDINEVLS